MTDHERLLRLADLFRSYDDDRDTELDMRIDCGSDEYWDDQTREDYRQVVENIKTGRRAILELLKESKSPY